ncbi:MAG: type 1 glutamine amidotransferase [Gorillibacterium sp.]|nr:type 1 glutamine amidotransferase [Gorillibacterium sp.]
MNIHAVLHMDYEGLGAIECWLVERGHDLSKTKLYLGDTLPAVDSFDWLIVMGGAMNIYEEEAYPWLIAEKALIREALKQNKKVLGICLGAQLLADALDAKVLKNKVKEIGWYPIQFTPEARVLLDAGYVHHEPTGLLDAEPVHHWTSESLTVFHWHGDTFELPQGAIPLAASEGCSNQAFIYGENAIGLQFHLEMEESDIERLIQHGLDELVDGPYIQTAEEIGLLTRKHAPAATKLLHSLLLGLERAY